MPKTLLFLCQLAYPGCAVLTPGDFALESRADSPIREAHSQAEERALNLRGVFAQIFHI